MREKLQELKMKGIRIWSLLLLFTFLFLACKDRFQNIVGLYQGEAINKLRYNKGKVVLDVKNYNKKNGVDANIKWSEGLSGEATLFGQVIDEKLILKGTANSQSGLFDLELECDCNDANNKIWCKYKLTPIVGKNENTLIQEGEFNVEKLSNIN